MTSLHSRTFPFNSHPIHPRWFWVLAVDRFQTFAIVNTFFWLANVSLMMNEWCCQKSDFILANKIECANFTAKNWCFDASSVTGFGENSPLWQEFESLWSFKKLLLNLLWQKKICHQANFNCCKWPKMKHYLAIWSHWLSRCALAVTTWLKNPQSVEKL